MFWLVLVYAIGTRRWRSKRLVKTITGSLRLTVISELRIRFAHQQQLVSSVVRQLYLFQSWLEINIVILTFSKPAEVASPPY